MREDAGHGYTRRNARVGLWAIPTTMLVFATAGYVASRTVPVGYDATWRLTIPARSDGDALLRDAAADLRAGLEVDIVPTPTTGLLIARGASSVDEAERALTKAANRIEGRVAAHLATLQPVVAEQPVASRDPTPEPAVAGEPDPAALAELRHAAEAARLELDATSKALSEFETTAQPASVDTASRVDAANAAVASLTEDLSALERAQRTVGSPSPSSAQVRSMPRFDDRDEFARLIDQRTQAGAEVADLSRTLLDGHPRMSAARQRLRELDAQVAARRASVLTTLDRRTADLRSRLATARDELATAKDDAERGKALAMRSNELVRARDLAREVSFRLDDTVRRAEEAAPDAPGPVPLPVPLATVVPVVSEPPPVASVVRTPLPTRTRHAAPLPVASVSAAFGLVLSVLGLLVSRRRPDVRPEPVAAPVAPEVEPSPVIVSSAVPTGPEVTSLDDVIDATLASGVTRVMLSGTSTAEGTRPLAVSIARRLALRGCAVALVDLSPTQAAARTMGIGATAPTVTDLIEGRASFAAIAARDFATRAEIIPGGMWTEATNSGTPFERRNVLDFAEKSYEAIVVDCTGLPLGMLSALMEADAALLLDVATGDETAVQSQVEALKAAGLLDMILVRETSAA